MLQGGPHDANPVKSRPASVHAFAGGRGAGGSILDAHLLMTLSKRPVFTAETQAGGPQNGEQRGGKYENELRDIFSRVGAFMCGAGENTQAVGRFK